MKCSITNATVDDNIHQKHRTRRFMSIHSMRTYVLCNNSSDEYIAVILRLTPLVVGGERISSKRLIRDKQKGRPQHPPSWVDYAFRPALNLFSLVENIFIDRKEKKACNSAASAFLYRINFYFFFPYGQHSCEHKVYSHRLISKKEEWGKKYSSYEWMRLFVRLQSFQFLYLATLSFPSQMLLEAIFLLEHLQHCVRLHDDVYWEPHIRPWSIFPEKYLIMISIICHPPSKLIGNWTTYTF